MVEKKEIIEEIGLFRLITKQFVIYIFQMRDPLFVCELILTKGDANAKNVNLI